MFMVSDGLNQNRSEPKSVLVFLRLVTDEVVYLQPPDLTLSIRGETRKSY